MLARIRRWFRGQPEQPTKEVLAHIKIIDSVLAISTPFGRGSMYKGTRADGALAVEIFADDMADVIEVPFRRIK